MQNYKTYYTKLQCLYNAKNYITDLILAVIVATKLRLLTQLYVAIAN